LTHDRVPRKDSVSSRPGVYAAAGTVARNEVGCGISVDALLPCRRISVAVRTIERNSPMTRRTLTGFVAGCFAGGLVVAALASGALRGQVAKSGAGLETSAQAVNRPAPPTADGKLRIICFGAHPDDCELKAGGTAALWAAKGHHVKFVSVTNGDI